MIVATAEIKIYVPWAQSLKEKRMVVKSIIAKVQNFLDALLDGFKKGLSRRP